MSLPVRGAWIEIAAIRRSIALVKSLPVRGAWIEISFRALWRMAKMSLPVRGAWIEIRLTSDNIIHSLVAPRAGSVD